VVATIEIRGNWAFNTIRFSETFASTGVVQKQCRHGGWKSFGAMFKNQGDCISFFATHGDNPPSGS
jgi:hypothetical protein